MIGRDQALHLALQPLLALVVLAVGTQAMTARVRHQRVLFAARAAQLHHRAGGAATALHGVECASLVGAEPLAEAGVEVGLEAGDDGGERDHDFTARARVKPSISPLMRSMA
jgi:hypothetical protein